MQSNGTQKKSIKSRKAKKEAQPQLLMPPGEEGKEPGSSDLNKTEAPGDNENVPPQIGIDGVGGNMPTARGETEKEIIDRFAENGNVKKGGKKKKALKRK
jgi:hypothetical protein